MDLIDRPALVDTIEAIPWYHINEAGKLASGANSELHTPLYKEEDIFKALEHAPTVDAVPVVLRPIPRPHPRKERGRMNMEKCRYEETCGHEYCNLTDCPEYEAKPMTNADRIRAMTDEELVKFLENVSNIGCIEIARNCRATCAACMMDWLREPVKEDAE